MMNFQDIKAFIDFASDPKKYKPVIEQLDDRQKKWEALVEVYTKVEDAAKYIASADKQAAAASAALAKERETFETWKAMAEAKLDTAKQKVKASQEKVDSLKLELDAKVEELNKTLAAAKADAAKAAELKAAAELQQSLVDSVAKEYQDRFDRLNSVLKGM